jgi:hypothetical protein
MLSHAAQGYCSAWSTPARQEEPPHEPRTQGVSPLWGLSNDRIKVRDDAFFLRLRVRNARGCIAAEDVQVLVAAYHAGELGLEGRALEWSGQHQKGQTPVTTLRVPPGLQRHVDLIKITSRKAPDEQVHEHGTPHRTRRRHRSMLGRADGTRTGPAFDARLCVYPEPWGGGHRVPANGDHDIEIIISAANADSISYELTISHDGELSAELLRPPKRKHRRGPLTLLKAALKLVLAGFRTSKL